MMETERGFSHVLPIKISCYPVVFLVGEELNCIHCVHRLEDTTFPKGKINV